MRSKGRWESFVVKSKSSPGQVRYEEAKQQEPETRRAEPRWHLDLVDVNGGGWNEGEPSVAVDL